MKTRPLIRTFRFDPVSPAVHRNVLNKEGPFPIYNQSVLTCAPAGQRSTFIPGTGRRGSALSQITFRPRFRKCGRRTRRSLTQWAEGWPAAEGSVRAPAEPFSFPRDGGLHVGGGDFRCFVEVVAGVVMQLRLYGVQSKRTVTGCVSKVRANFALAAFHFTGECSSSK